LFRLSQFHVSEIRRGRHGLGDNMLHDNSQMLSKDSNLPAMYNPVDHVDQIRAGTNSNLTSSDPSATASTSSSTDVDSIDVDDYNLGNTVTYTNVNSAASSATASTSSIADCAWQYQ
jgi:hypothetical protein